MLTITHEVSSCLLVEKKSFLNKVKEIKMGGSFHLEAVPSSIMVSDEISMKG